MAKKKSAKKKTVKKSATKKGAKKKGGAMTSAARAKAKKPAKKAMKQRPKARKRELIDTGTDKRYVRRDAAGQFKDVVDVGRSLAADIRQHAATPAAAGQGDRGD